MNKSLRYGVMAATSATFLALAPGLALAVGAPDSPSVGREVNNTMSANHEPTRNQSAGQATMNQANPGTSDQASTKGTKGLAGTYTSSEKQQKGDLAAKGTSLNGSSDMQNSGQSAGVTSGPAAGSNVVPNTATAKHGSGSQENMAEANTNGGSTTHTAGNASMGVGAPGTPAHQGTEAGKAPMGKSTQQ